MFWNSWQIKTQTAWNGNYPGYDFLKLTITHTRNVYFGVKSNPPLHSYLISTYSYWSPKPSLFLNQSNEKLKPIAIWSTGFSRALHAVYICLLRLLIGPLLWYFSNSGQLFFLFLRLSPAFFQFLHHFNRIGLPNIFRNCWKLATQRCAL